MNSTAGIFRLLGDGLRLRILRVLRREKLNVSELTSLFGVAQSGISRHLRLLREAGLVAESREGGWVYYSIDPGGPGKTAGNVWPLLVEQLEQLEDCAPDDAKLQEILRQRHEDFRDQGQKNRGINPGRSWAAWARTLSYLVPSAAVADLGCGEGYLTLEVARWAHHVIAIDHSRKMLQSAKELARRHGARNITWKQGKLEKVPIANGDVDVVLLSQVLHCLKDPEAGLREARRILKPGGSVLIQELRPHSEEWVRERLGDKWLGFEERQLRSFLKNSGFKDVRLNIGAKRRGDPFVVWIGAGRKA